MPKNLRNYQKIKIMNEETYKALGDIMKHLKHTGTPKEMLGSIGVVSAWMEEVAKDYFTGK